MTDVTLADWLLERIAEDEAAAKFAAAEVGWAPPGPERVQSGAKWTTSYHVVVRSRAGAGAPLEKRPVADCGALGLSPAEHIARHDPARVLAECEAKRRIVELHPEYGWSHCEGEPLPCPTLRLLAQPYADHPGYDESWRP